MQAMPIRIFLVLFIFALIYPSLLIAERIQPPPDIKSGSPTPPEIPKTNANQKESAEVLPGLIASPERRTALVIGNSSYDTGSLRNPVNDADDMAASLKRLGFDVILKKNATQQDMEDAIRNFGDRLKKGGVGLFFYAGHGAQIAGKNFLLPIGARIDRDTDVKYRAMDTDMVLDEMGNAGNPMNIVILDACRDNPFGKSFRTASRGLAIISSAPRGTLVSYSTSPGNIAADGGGRNSPYTGSLMKHMMTPGLPIEEVFKNVRQDLGRQTGGKQIPWELSSLEGQFYFNPQENRHNNLPYATSYATKSASQTEPDKLARLEAAIAAAEKWLPMVDSGNYGQSWREAAGYFRYAINEEKWVQTINAVRNPLGKLISREVQNTTYWTSLPNAPEGEYIVIQFKTSFGNKKSAIETVTPMFEKDGIWRVSGYYIQ